MHIQLSNKSKTSHIAFVIFLLIFPIFGIAGERIEDRQQEKFERAFNELANPQFEILPFLQSNSLPTELPQQLGEVDFVEKSSGPKKSIFQSNPNGRYNGPITRACHFTVLENQILSSMGKPKAQAQAIQNYFNQCGSQLVNQHVSNSLIAIIQLGRLKYPFYALPNIREVRIKLPHSTTRGLLVLKPDLKRRPLVIVKCGTLCGLEEGPTLRNQLAHLFDESPFHVLLLGNISSTQYQIDNQNFGMGGYAEGNDLFRMAQLFRNPAGPFQQYFSSLHLVGISLGGHGALYAALYASQLRNTELPLFNSVIASCPVVDLKASTEHVYTHAVLSKLMRVGTLSSLRQLFRSIPILGDILNIDDNIPTYEIPKKIAMGSVGHYQKLVQRGDWALAPLNHLPMNDIHDFWEANDFVRFAPAVRTPLLILAAQDDPVVPYHHNVGKIQDAPFLYSVVTPKGSHCAFSFTHGWPTLSALLRSFILSHSPEFYKKDHFQELHLNWHKHLNKKLTEKFFAYRWKAKKNKDYLLLTMKKTRPYANSGTESCRDFSETDLPYECYSIVNLKVPFSSFSPHELSIPQSKLEAQVLERWANTNLVIWGDDGRLFLDQSNQPKFIRFPKK